MAIYTDRGFAVAGGRQPRNLPYLTCIATAAPSKESASLIEGCLGGATVRRHHEEGVEARDPKLWRCLFTTTANAVAQQQNYDDVDFEHVKMAPLTRGSSSLLFQCLLEFSLNRRTDFIPRRGMDSSKGYTWVV